jgi:hypothetical protein
LNGVAELREKGMAIVPGKPKLTHIGLIYQIGQRDAAVKIVG